MNISISRVIVLILGVVLLVFGVKFLIDAIPAKDWLLGLLALIGIAVGYALVVGKGVTVST